MISEEQMLLLRALSATGELAVAAFLEWRARVPLNDIDNSAFRIISLLVNLVRREGLNDADILRLKGIERHIWAANTLKLRQLFHALDILERAKVRPMLLKGAALMARMPAIAAKRIVGDYDILIEDAAVERAKTHLINAGYWMVGFSFDDLDGELQRSPTAGVPIASIGGAGEIDLHWRSLPNIFDPDLTRTLFEAGEQHAIQGRAVLVPTLTHHLFLTLARCQPWDQHECFTRLIEGYFLLVDSISHVDWNELSTLVRKHGLEASAVVFLDILQKECRVKVPKWFLARLRWSAVGLKAQEWRIRSLPPAVRSPVQNWFLERQDRTYYRSQSEILPPSLIESFLSQYGKGGERLVRLWDFASRRYSGASTKRPRYLSGFSYPESGGRWSEGVWAAMAVPLSEQQRSGQDVSILAQCFDGARFPFRISATGGITPITRIVAKGESADIVIKMRPLPQLGGDGLLLLWLPDSRSPKDAGVSHDTRQLGLYIRRPPPNG